MYISALKFVCCCSEKHSLPIYVYKGKGTNNHLLERDLEYEKYCNHWKKSFYYLQTLVMTKIEEGDIKNTNHRHIYRKKYGISRVSVILEDLRIKNVTRFIQTPKQFLFIMKKRYDSLSFM